MTKDLHTLPAGLPVPEDDGACDHLPGRKLPPLALASTDGGFVDLSTLRGVTVLYCYPMLGRPDAAPMPGWNEIPGARGCTPESCAFRDAHAALTAAGATLFGVSHQPLIEQQEARERLRLPFALLHDTDLALTQALALPTFEYAGRTHIKRLTLIAHEDLITKVFYPIFPPQDHAAAVAAWLRDQSALRD
ncbi:MAG TPA: peroxiredoxin [Acidiferrobacteraceae bacterium]|nr:peroxiredoxin [Acidiferrobacteraceae bacterium]